MAAWSTFRVGHDASVHQRQDELCSEFPASWQATFMAVSAGAVMATVKGTRGTRVAAALLGGSFTLAIFGARRLVSEAIISTRDRERDQRLLVDAQLGQALSPAHDAINAVEADLYALLADANTTARCRLAARGAAEQLDHLAALLRNSRQAREALADDEGVVPLLGIRAAHRRFDPRGRLMRRYGSRETMPGAIPADLRGAARQVGLVLDELRLLHTAEIERSVLLFTLVSRAVLLSFAPLLGAWSVARPPLADGHAVADAAWAAAAAVSLGTAFAAPRLVDLVMEDSSAGRRTRSLLLGVEVPIAFAALPLIPAWTVVVFASGWTNWWQRQTPGLGFDGRKLVAFVGVVVALQGAGLAREHIPIGPAVGEIAVALLAIALTGGSYGAMLPLSAGTGLDVLVGDGRRSLRAVMRARRELLSSARQLVVTAAEIDASAPDSLVARRAAATARQAARQLDHAADRAGRRGLVTSHVLVELASEAIARSYLRRRRPIELEQPESSKQAAPPYATEPIYDPPQLLAARVIARRDARVLRSVIERSLNEARVHGTKSVRVVLRIHNGRLEVRIANRPRGRTHGISGEGGRDLDRLVRKLPDGRLKRGLRPPREIRMPAGPDWWVVEVSCSADVLDRTMEYFARDDGGTELHGHDR